MQKTTSQSAIDDLIDLIAELMAKRWYQMQKEPRATTPKSNHMKGKACESDIVAHDADASHESASKQVKKPRKKK